MKLHVAICAALMVSVTVAVPTAELCETCSFADFSTASFTVAVTEHLLPSNVSASLEILTAVEGPNAVDSFCFSGVDAESVIAKFRAFAPAVRYAFFDTYECVPFGTALPTTTESSSTTTTDAPSSTEAPSSTTEAMSTEAPSSDLPTTAANDVTSTEVPSSELPTSTSSTNTSEAASSTTGGVAPTDMTTDTSTGSPNEPTTAEGPTTTSEVPPPPSTTSDATTSDATTPSVAHSTTHQGSASPASTEATTGVPTPPPTTVVGSFTLPVTTAFATTVVLVTLRDGASAAALRSELMRVYNLAEADVVVDVQGNVATVRFFGPNAAGLANSLLTLPASERAQLGITNLAPADENPAADDGLSGTQKVLIYVLAPVVGLLIITGIVFVVCRAKRKPPQAVGFHELVTWETERSNEVDREIRGIPEQRSPNLPHKEQRSRGHGDRYVEAPSEV